MPSVCFYFQVHQPFRTKKFGVLDIGNKTNYFDDKKNKEICQKVAQKCYLPTNRIILDLIKKHKGKFRCSYSISGTALEQFEKYTPEVLESFKKLADTGCVEFLAETYYHSLSSLYSQKEFYDQVMRHSVRIEELFGQKPKVFRNTELVYANHIGDRVSEFGFDTVLAEGWEPHLTWRSPNFVYLTPNNETKLLLKNYKLSDDVAFRFSNKDWEGWPLTAHKYAHWIHALDGNSEIINLFMDYETFGEHQWEETGIFDFLRHLPDEILKNDNYDFVTVSEGASKYEPKDIVSIPEIISWADMERDISAWVGNKMQNSIIEKIYDMEERIKEKGDEVLLDVWRKLQTSDHFYYMCTKYWSDGDVHKYFNAFEKPHDSYSALNNILTDLTIKLDTS